MQLFQGPDGLELLSVNVCMLPDCVFDRLAEQETTTLCGAATSLPTALAERLGLSESGSFLKNAHLKEHMIKQIFCLRSWHTTTRGNFTGSKTDRQTAIHGVTQPTEATIVVAWRASFANAVPQYDLLLLLRHLFARGNFCAWQHR